MRDAYGMDKDEDALKFLLELNLELSNKESLGEKIVGPGLPPCVKDPKQYVTKDCIDINYWESDVGAVCDCLRILQTINKD